MITKKDISKGAVSNTHISRSAEIDPSKLKGDKVGSILIADRDGKYVARKIRGDASLLPNGEFRVASTAPAGVVTEEEVRGAGGLIGKDIKHGSTLVGERDGTPKEVNVGTGSNAIPQRDSSGNLKAETADLATNATTATTATNADKLDDQEGTHYLDVTNHTAQGTATALGIPENSVGISSANKQGFPKIVYEANTGGGSNSYFTIPHALGYIPQVTIMHGVLDGSNTVYKEIDAEVESSTSQTIVRCSEQGLNLKVYLT
jgi:hypothetical protein